MNKPNKIILHCSGTKPLSTVNVNSIRRFHVEDNKWNDIGYHYVITIDGTVQEGRPLNVVGSHTKGHNTNSIGICLVGGEYDSNHNKFYEVQFNSLRKLLRELFDKYDVLPVYGHYEFNKHKTCPNFDVKQFMLSMV